MISSIIVISSIVFALLFTLAYVFWPGVRERVEQPKYSFQEQLTQYDKQRLKGQQQGQQPDQELANEK